MYIYIYIYIYICVCVCVCVGGGGRRGFVGVSVGVCEKCIISIGTSVEFKLT